MAEIKARRFLQQLYRYAWMGLVSLLILAAVVFTVVRLALPFANSYRVEVESVLTETLGQGVSVDEMTAELNGIRPSLVLNGVTVYDSRGIRKLFQFDSLSLGFSVTKSLREGRPIPVSLDIRGTQINLVRHRKGDMRLNGVSLKVPANGSGPGSKSPQADNETAAETKAPQAAQYQPVLQWLFQHGRLHMEEVGLNYHDEVNDTNLHFPQMELKLKNSGARHQIDGLVSLPDGWGGNSGFSIDIVAAELMRPQDWQISAFFLGQDLNLPNLNRAFPIDGTEVRRGTAAARLWLEWRHGRIDAVDGDVSILDLAYGSPRANTEFGVGALTAQFHARHGNNNNILLNIDELNLVDSAIPREPMRLSMSLNPQSGDFSARANLVYLQDLRDMLAASGQLDKQWRERLEGVAPSGEVRDLHLDYRPGHGADKLGYDLAFRLQDMSTRAWNNIPKVSGLAGTVWMNEDSGALQLNSRNMVADIRHVFRSPWDINKLEGQLQWRRVAGRWHVSTQRIHIDGADLDMNVRMQLMLAAGKRPAYLDLVARFEEGDVSQLHRYYPVNIMKPKLVKWLDRAIKSGQASSGGVVYRGWLRKGDYPFVHKQGKFEVNFDAEDAVLDYLPDWPAIKKLKAHLVFDGPGMRIESKSAQMNGLNITRMTARIPDFKRAILQLEGDLEGATQNSVAFIANSPLRESFSAVIDRLSASGRSELDLSMTIPLSPKLGHMRYQGDLLFKDTRFLSPLGEGRLEARAVNGQLRFTEQGFEANDIRASIFGQPARIQVSTANGNGDRVVETIIRGAATSKALNAELKVGLLRYLDGEAPLEARVQMFSGSRNLTLLSLNSQMQGMAIDLPDPMGKAADIPAELNAQWDFNTRQLDISFRNDVHAALWLDDATDAMRLRRGELRFGPGEAAVPTTNVLRLSGKLEDFPLSQWLRSFNADQGNGDSVDGLPMQVRLDYLQVREDDEAESETSPSSSRASSTSDNELPTIDIDIRELFYKDIELGRFNMLANGFNNGYKIDVLAFNGPLFSFSSKGYWNQGDSPLTALSIQLNARSTERLLSRFGFDTPIRGGRLSVDGNLQWPGSPGDFKIEDLEGASKFRISDGRLENIEPGAGRVLGLFSFQALPRRLALDFRDLFGKGYRFDSIRGQFKLEDGNAYTPSIVINSPSARITMSGRTGLKAQDYDYDVIVVPGDGTNLFVAGALAGGVQTGVVVWLVEKMLNIEKYTRFIYKIEGTWEDPVVTNLSEGGTPQSAP
ncbi:MAG: hypothetical protein HUJ29_13730 [Gammaproteobacteria bacterium]|nr:hypothetical protein [Gammaproteobacteria bacterium]